MRSRDMHMAAAIDTKRRTVMVTGGIDQNEQTLSMRIDIPEAGVWTFIKSEVNLTDDPWVAWQISLGGGCKIPINECDRLIQCRQFEESKYFEDRGQLTFFNGEVRPGEPILKIFNVEIPQLGRFDSKIVILSHARLSKITDANAVRAAAERGFGDDFPTLEISVPSRLIT
jgi:Family of unknown function (DUF6423)